MPKHKIDEAEDSAVAVAEVQTELPASEVEVQIPAPKTIEVPENFFIQLLKTLQEMANNQTKALGKVIEEIRKPIHDPIKEAQQKRAKATQEAAQAAFWAALQNRAVNCSHLREDMSSCIAWAEQSDTYADYPELCAKNKVFPHGISGTAQMGHLRRGTCQHCQTLFSPRREECVSEEVWERYQEVLRIPTGRGSNSVTYVG